MDKPKVYETFIERSNRSGSTNTKKLKNIFGFEK